MTADTTQTNDVSTQTDIGQPATAVKRRGKKPSGIVKNNVCVRLTEGMKDYLLTVGEGSTSRGVDALIAWHREVTSQDQTAAQPVE